ncbi:MAG TPA: LytR C-terminal domain-containing protein [Acidimicrobiales bacterium]|nr:LytR C-terminal domain-containing protein [Acidimicrobiales bacterium]
MQPPDGSGQGPEHGSPGRGVLLTAAALLVGIGVLAKVAHPASTATPTASATATTVGSSSTTSTTNGSTPASTPASTGAPTTTAPRGATTTTLATHSPGSVKVIVANGTSSPGLAGKLKSKLAADGYNVLAPENTSAPARASTVYYAAGFQGDGQAVAIASGLTSSATQAMGSSAPVTNASTAQVVVVIGPDLANALNS